MSKIYVAIDLEMAQPSGKIIQIGAAAGDIEKKTVIDSLSVFINPEEELTDFIKKLTGISQDDVDGGVDLVTGYSRLTEFVKKHGASPMLLEWGQGDCRALKQQLGPTKWELGRTSMNVKNIHQFQQLQKSEKIQGGLAKALLRNGLNFDGKKHNAEDDAKNTLLVFFKMLENDRKEALSLMKEMVNALEIVHPIIDENGLEIEVDSNHDLIGTVLNKYRIWNENEKKNLED